MRRRRLGPVAALVGVLVAALLATPPSVAALPAPERVDVDWAHLPYVHYNEDGFFFYVPTNSETFTATRVTSVPSGFEEDFRTPEQLSDDKVLEALWAEDCPAVKEQTVTQSRKVYLPGPPGELFVNLQMSNVSPASHMNKNPIAWAELRINKIAVARVERGDVGMNQWEHVDGTTAASLVKPGLNTITVVAKKGKTKKAWGYCSYESIPSFGVAAEVYGVPETGMYSYIPRGTFTGTVVDTTATITNNGPSYVLGGLGGFSFSTGPETNADVSVLTLSSSQASCADSVSTGDGWSASCVLPDLGPGSSVTVDVHLEFTAGTCPIRIPYAFHATSNWRDPDPADNGASDRAITC